ncbi:hypothetical protein FB45DRAFT_1064996 [Roridomyces roridus]|uniref:Zn(2)-C6 fungal-type domain-containing protein n=1 Tax=Roridomyces roridus TaxID=1738132 RepID=A0AAD7B851_9AGAR|nr:hypothetical protein FB45DRAFT_1064996 [Roridomyces roridus]
MVPIQRGPRACSNCRRRKIKCDGARPKCSQCRLRPPRSKMPCEYPRIDGWPEDSQASEMLETIQTLRARVAELERYAPPDPARIYLQQPYAAGSESLRDFGEMSLTTGRSSPFDMPEPPSNLMVNLIDAFLNRFSGSTYFFLDASTFRTAALLPLPFGHQSRPSPALLCVAYLWGALLLPSSEPYDPEVFLACILQNILHDISGCEAPSAPNAKLVLETIQAQVLLSFYYLDTAQPVQGRIHAAGAASLAFSTSLNEFRPQTGAPDEMQRVNAFWAVVTLNNFWVAAYGGPSAVPYGVRIDTPWPGSVSNQGSGSISSFLSGHDSQGSALAITYLIKSSVLLERILAFVERAGVGPADSTAFATLDRRLHTFQAVLPPLSPLLQASQAEQERALLLIAHALVDTAVVRLHMRAAESSASARGKCLTAASRIVDAVRGYAGVGVRPDPIIGPICSAAARVYTTELGALAMTHSPRAASKMREVEDRLGGLMSVMTSLAGYSPLIERCIVDIQAAYAGVHGMAATG